MFVSYSTSPPSPHFHPPLSALHIILRSSSFLTSEYPFFFFYFYREILTFMIQSDLERLANSDGNGMRYDALKRRVYQSAIPGTMSFQSNTGFQSSHPSHSSPVHSRPMPPNGSMAPSSQTHRESESNITMSRVAR